MITRTKHLKELLSKTIEPAILVVDEKLSIQYNSPNTAHYLKLPKTLTTLKQLETLNKVAFTSIIKTAICSINNLVDIKISENLALKNKNYSINLKIQKLQTEPLKDALFSISISKCAASKIASLNPPSQNGEKEVFKNAALLESKLNNTLTELNLLKKENESLKSAFEATNKNLAHVKTEYDINLNEQYELNFFMKEMLKNANVATVFLNLDLQIIKYTPLLSKLFDIEDRDIGRKITDFNHVFTSNDWITHLQKVIKTGNRTEVELSTKKDQYYLMIINPAKFSHIDINVLSISFIDISSQVKATQDKLTSEQKFRTLFESAVDGMSIIDLDKKVIVVCNKKMPKLFGISKEVYLSTNPYNFFPEFQSDGTKSIDLIKKLHDTLHQKGQASLILEHKHKTKGNFFARLSKYKIPLAKQNYVAVVLQNIDKEIRTIEALKKSEQELNEVKDRYKNLYDNSIDGIGVFDLAKQEVVEINNSLIKMTGFSNEEYIARAPFGVFTENLADGSPTKDLYIQMVSHLVKGGKKSVGHFLHLHKTKAPFHVEISALKLPKPNQHIAVCVTRNIDVEKKAEARSALHVLQLEASESMHKAFFNQSLDGHVILNMKDMMPVEVNQRLLKMFRISKTEYFQASPLDFFDAENNSFNAEEAFKDFRTSIEKNIPFEIEVYIKTKKRKSFLVKVLINLLSEPNQHLVYAVVKDIDKERKAEEATTKHLTALTASESMHKTFFNQSLDAHIILSAESMAAIEVNHRTLKLLRISKTEFFNTDLYAFCDSTKNDITQAQFFEAIQASLAKNIPYEAEMYMKSSKRKSFLAKLLINQMPAPNEHLIYSVIKDIDDERKAKEAANAHLKALAASESMFRTFFENGLDGFGIAQIFPKPKPIDVNQRMLELTGLSKKEFLNSSILDLMHPKQTNNKSGKAVFDEITQSIMQKGFYRGEVVYTNKKSGPFYTNITMVRLKPPNDNKIFIQVANKDKEVKALQQLAESESMFRTFFESGQDGFGIVQLLPKLKSININSRLSELHGLSKKEYFATKVLDLISPKQSNNKTAVELLEEIKQNLLKKGFHKGEVIYEHKKNGPFYASTKIVKLPAPNDDKIFVQIADKDKEVKALQQVAKSETFFKSIFANSLDGIVIYNTDDFEVFDCNERALQMTNCTLQQFKNSNLKDFLPEKQPNGILSLPAFKQYLKNVTENKNISREWVFKRYNSNELVHSRISIIKLPKPFNKLAAISIADITKTKLAEKAVSDKNKAIAIVNQELSISLKKFKDTFDNSANFIGRLNLKGQLVEHNLTIYNNLTDKNAPSTNIYIWNFPWYKNHKYTQRQLKQDFESAKNGQSTKSQVAYTISPNFAGVLEYTFKPLKNEKGEVTSILGEGYDVTEQVNALKKLEFNEQKFRGIFNNSSNFIGIINSKGIILDLNKTVTTKLDNKEVPTLGIAIWNFPWFMKHKNAQLALKKGVKQANQGEKAEGIINYTIPNRLAGTMQFTITPIFDEKGKVAWLLGEGKDISKIISVQRELSYKEQKFRAIFNNSSNFIGLYDKAGYIEELNRPLLKQIDESQSPGTSPKVKIWDIPWISGFKESQQAFKAGFKKVLKGEIDRGIIQYSPVDNHTGIFEYTLSPIFDENNKVIKVLGEGKDITEQLRAQKEIEASEKRFRALFYNAKNRIVRLSPNGKIIAHNKIYKGRKNYASNKKYIGMYLWQLIERNHITKSSYKQIKLAVKKAANGAFVSNILLGLDAKNQKIFLNYSLKPVFDANGKVEWILGESNNITEIINAQQKLALKEQKFRAIFNNSSNFIGLYNLDGTIEELNKPILEKIPKNKRTRINSNLKLWELPLSNQFKKAIKQVFSAGLKKVLKGEVYKATAHYSLNDNKETFLEFIFSPVFDEKNKVFKILGEGRDITEQINSIKQIEESEKRFKALFLNAENIVVRLSPEGRVIAHNKIVKSAVNYDLLKEYIGKYLWEFSGVFKNKKAQEQLKRDIKKAANGKLAYGSIFSKDNQHQQIQLSYSFKPIFGTNNTVEWILGEARDITDFIKAQQKFKAIFYNSENYIARLDAKGNVLEHSRVHKDNPRYEVVKQYIGKPLWEFSGIVEHQKSIVKLKKNIKECASGQFVSNQITMRVYKTNHSKDNPQFKSGLVVYTLTPVFGKNNAVDWILAEAKDITELDEAKNKLSSSLNKYQKLFENNLVGIIILDENLKLVECNKAYEKITGYSLNETKALNYYDFIDKKEIEEAKINEQKIKTNNIKSLEFKRTFTKKDGEKVFVNLYLKPIYVNKKFTSAVVTIADITELENKRAALKQSEELYKAVFEGVNDGLYVYNVKNNKIIAFNERLLKIASSKSKKQFLARADEQFIPYLKGKNAQKTNWIKKINTHLKSHKIAKFDFSLGKSKGMLLDLSTSTIKLNDSLSLTAVTDITETKKAQQALLESETKYRSLFENNVTGIALGNKFGQILQVNDALCNMFGYSKKEMLKLKHQDLSSQGEDDQSYIHFKAMVDGKTKKFSTTKQFIKKNGDVFYAIIFISGIYDKKNNFKYNIASISDISELKNLENELKVKQLELADKIAELEKYIESNLELENFAFIASHDLKSPTRTIINYANLLIEKAEKKLDPVELQFLKFIIEGSNRLQNTISDLLNFSLANNNALNIKKVNLNTLLKNIIKDLNSTIVETNATIKIEGLPAYNWVDKGLYKELFLNLIGNALKFHSKRKKPLVKITCKKIDTSYLFSVEDNGIGIAKKSQQKIFGIFQRLHIYSEFEGTGIGLALCKKVVEKHKGKIWVESAKGKGSKFYFTLPYNLKQLNEKI